MTAETPAPSPVTCPRCEVEVKWQARFCVQCGIKFPEGLCARLPRPELAPSHHALINPQPRYPHERPARRFDPANLQTRAQTLGEEPPPPGVSVREGCRRCEHRVLLQTLVAYEYSAVFRMGGTPVEFSQTLSDWVHSADHLRIILKDFVPRGASLEEMQAFLVARDVWHYLLNHAAFDLDLSVDVVHIRPCPACGERDALGLADALDEPTRRWFHLS